MLVRGLDLIFNIVVENIEVDVKVLSSFSFIFLIFHVLENEETTWHSRKPPPPLKRKQKSLISLTVTSIDILMFQMYLSIETYGSTWSNYLLVRKDSLRNNPIRLIWLQINC